jgi:hypothetical protein
MEFFQRIIDELEQEIRTNEEKFIHTIDPLQRESLEKMIHEDKASLNRLYDELSQPAPSKFRNILPSFNLLFLSYFVQQLLL